MQVLFTLAVFTLLAGSVPAADDVVVASPQVINLTGPNVLEHIKASPGKAVLVNVWATWCQPCVEEFPELLKIREQWKDQGLELMFISADFDTQMDRLAAFLKDKKVDFTTYHKAGKDMEFIDSFGTKEWSGALPVTMLFDDSGALVKVWNEKITPEMVSGEIGRILQQE